jgi:exopolysaccharide production protein ExoZ
MVCLVMSRHPGIQLLRALAAVMVLVGHVLAEAEHYFEQSFALARLPWTRGVDIFFVISGFIITLSASRIWGTRRASLRFIRHRILRVVPLYYLFTTLMVAALILVPTGVKDTVLDPLQIISSYLFIPYERYDGRIAPVLSLGWTLNYEMFFYGIMALALALPRRAGLLVALGVLTGLSVMGIIARPNQTMLAFWTNPIILTFVFGILIARAQMAGMAPKKGGMAVFVIGLGALLVLNTVVFDLPRFISSGIPAAMIVAAPVLFSKQTWAPRLGLLMGDASYALYLSHRFILRAATLVLLPLLPASAPGASIYTLLVCGAAILAGICIYFWIETPMLRWAERWR